MKHKIKMIGYDLDGTLLTTDKKLTSYTKEVLKEAIRRGIIVLPVTGRPFSGIPDEIRGFEGIHYLITSNGARIIEDGTSIYERLLPVENARKILDIFEEYDTLREIYYDGQGYAQEHELNQIEYYINSAAMAGYITSSRLSVPDLRGKFEEENRDLDKIQAIFRYPKDKEKAWKRVSALKGVEVTGALDNNIEVNSENVHKGIALMWLAKKLGIQQDEIMTFGDGSNDLKMIRDAGVGVAMSNGIERVKEAADLIAESNDEDGVAKIIEQYVLNDNFEE
ncbi:MAG: Cof-type HAD-IIB family hydrolase [Lachnospiraceae bacterium]